MPRYDQNTETFTAPDGFQFTGTQIEKLGSTKYTLFTIFVDITGSVLPYKDLISQTIRNTVEGCKLNPVIADNVLVRVVFFNSHIGVKEIHGFRELSNIDLNDYKIDDCYGMTNLFDANYEVLESTKLYAANLRNAEFLNNSIIVCITDGEDNTSKILPFTIRESIKELRKSEQTESLLLLLYGLNGNNQMNNFLEDYKNDVGFDKYEDAGNLTPESSAKLAGIIIDNVSSQSSSLGTGQASKPLTFNN